MQSARAQVANMKRNPGGGWGSAGFDVGLPAAVPRSVWISMLSSLGVLLLGLVAITPLAERRMHSEAEKRGLHLEMEDFRLGWFTADLTDVKVRLEGVERLRVTIDRVHVDLALGSPRLRALIAEGGHVTVDGTIDAVQSELEGWRKRRSKTSKATAAAKPSARRDILRNFEIKWVGAFDDKTQLVSGLQLERGPAGLRLGADLVEVESKEVAAQIAGLILEAKTPALDLSQAEKVGAAEMRIIYSAPRPDEASHPTRGPPKSVPESETQEHDNDAEDEGLDKQLEKDSARVGKIKAGLGIVRNELVPRLPQKAQVDKLWVTYQRDDEKLHVGPNLLSIENREGFVVRVVPQGNTKGTPLELSLTVHPTSAENAVSVDLKGGPVSLATLGINEGAFGLSGVAHTQVSGGIAASLNQEATTFQGQGEAWIDGLAIDSEKLSASLVTFPKLSLSGKGALRVDGTFVQIEDATIRMGETSFDGALSMERADDFVTLKARASAPLVSCQALLDSAPRGLLGAAEQMKFDGTFSLDAGVEADTRKLADMKVRWNFKNGCRVKSVPAELDPDQFRSLFRREVLGAGNFPMELEFGPLSTHWTPWEEVSPYVEKALLVTEDGRFYRHNGFDDRAIESAIRDNVKSGHFVRGASTISMQLAKNLYLSRRKTLARKFQEAALTSLLEQDFEKHELLELYVNVVEFGPGIYGIRNAAEHYFATTPARLTPAQAFFLASILPAPSRQHFDDAGNLSESRSEHVKRLLKISHSRDAISDAELESALKEELVFGKSETLPEQPNEPAFDPLPEDAPSREGEKSPDDRRRKSKLPTLHDEPIFPAR